MHLHVVRNNRLRLLLQTCQYCTGAWIVLKVTFKSVSLDAVVVCKKQKLEIFFLALN